MSFPTAELREYLLHLSEDVAKRLRLLDLHPVGAHAKAEPPGTVKRVLRVPPEAVIIGPIFIIVVVVIFIMSHGIEEGVPDDT